MAIVLTPVAAPTAPANTVKVIGVDDNILSEVDVIRLGCPMLVKDRAIVIPKGLCATVEWPMRARDGRPYDLSCVLAGESGEESESSESSVSISVSAETSEPGQVKARFAHCDGGTEIYENSVTAVEPSTGLLHFQIPDALVAKAGIYQVQVGVQDGQSRLLAVDSGIISVERGLWGDVTQVTGPPTLNDIRVEMRDFAHQNELLGEEEFDIAEIMSSIVNPIREWNETPPPVARHNCSSFPYTQNWLNAIVGYLLDISVHHYMRNSLKMNHGGMSGNHKEKASEYAALAAKIKREWKDFITQKKIEINAGLGEFSILSPYSGHATWP